MNTLLCCLILLTLNIKNSLCAMTIDTTQDILETSQSEIPSPKSPRTIRIHIPKPGEPIDSELMAQERKNMLEALERLHQERKDSIEDRERETRLRIYEENAKLNRRARQHLASLEKEQKKRKSRCICS